MLIRILFFMILFTGTSYAEEVLLSAGDTAKPAIEESDTATPILITPPTVFRKVNDKISTEANTDTVPVNVSSLPSPTVFIHVNKPSEQNSGSDATIASEPSEIRETEKTEPLPLLYSADTRLTAPPPVVPSLNIPGNTLTIRVPDFFRISGNWQIKGFRMEEGIQCTMMTTASNGSEFVYIVEVPTGAAKASVAGFLLSSHSPEGQNAVLKLGFDHLLSITFRAVVKTGALEMMMSENPEAVRTAWSALRYANSLMMEEISTGNKLTVNLKGSRIAASLLSECAGIKM